MLNRSQLQTLDSGKYLEKDYVLTLHEVANKLLWMVPSQVQDEDIRELEHFLNVLYARAHAASWPLDLQEAVLEALSRASELSDRVSRMPSGTFRDRNFFKTLKSFIPILKMVAVFLEE